MPYDETLAGRVRGLLSVRDDVSERAMFGGLTFMLGGHICCGVSKNELIVRLHEDDVDAALARPHARPMDFTGRPMRGFVTVGPAGLNGQAIKRWVGIAVAHAESRPPKQEEQASR